MASQQNNHVAPNVLCNNRNATITIDFARLWDLMSIHQRQFAFYLSNPDQFPSQYDPDNDFVFCSWPSLTPRIRIAILEAFLLLPGVHEISHTNK